MERSNLSWSWMSALVSSLLLVAGGFAATGCGMSDQSTSPQSLEDERDGPGIAVSSAALSNSGTAKIKFKIFEQGTYNKVASGIRELSDLKIPGGMSSQALSKLDTDSEHKFADFYKVLEAGKRYDVKTIPLDAYGNRNNMCDVAWAKNVPVEDGRTNEILVINQCEGKKRGGLDVISALNHPPHIKKLKFKPSKFVKCGHKVAICMKAKDKDKDPIRTEWKVYGSNKQPKVVPAKHLYACKKKCGNNAGNSSSKSGKSKYQCIRRCLYYKKHKQKKRCKHSCKKKCYGQGNGQMSSSGKHNGCFKRCKHRCMNQNQGKVAECAIMKARKNIRGLKVKVFDQMWKNRHDNKPYNDRLIDFETYFKHTGNYKKSRDYLRFPLHVGGQCKSKPKKCDCKKNVKKVKYLVKRKVNAGAQSNSGGGYSWVKVSDLSQVQQGEKVKAKFYVSQNCKNKKVRLTIASYKAKGPTWNQAKKYQRLYDWASGKFGPGYHTLGPIKMPDCHFQADFVCGKKLTGRQIVGGTLYGKRKIDWVNGGQTSCKHPGGCTKPGKDWSKYAACHPYLKKHKFCGKSWYKLLHYGAQKHQYWYKLARVVIATKLSVKYGAWLPPGIYKRLHYAVQILKNHCGYIPTKYRGKVHGLIQSLKHFNHGKTGPGVCKKSP